MVRVGPGRVEVLVDSTSISGSTDTSRLWVPVTVLTAVDLPLRHLPSPGMIRRWR